MIKSVLLVALCLALAACSSGGGKHERDQRPDIPNVGHPFYTPGTPMLQ